MSFPVLNLYEFQCSSALFYRRLLYVRSWFLFLLLLSAYASVPYTSAYSIAVVDKATASLYCPFPLIGRFD